MYLSSLEVENFRNLRCVSMACSPGLNLICGANASGKTSLLEALYFLGRGRSFRTRQVRELIFRGERAFRLVTIAADGERRVPVGIERDAQSFNARVGGQPARTLTELAERVPLLLLTPESHRLLGEGPGYRRRFIDWGVFHREPRFLDAWRRYGSALKHRNAALRTSMMQRAVGVWDVELDRSAALIDRFRGEFCTDLECALVSFADRLLGMGPLAVDYRRGWNPELPLAEVLARNREQDQKYGFTRPGPHRAEFIVRLGDRPAAEQLSRGQQKLLVLALVLAQADLYRRQRGSSCILLVDDLPSELDAHHREQAMACLGQIRAQLFITAIEPQVLDIQFWPERQIYNLEKGELRLNHSR